jgi:small subunit ribosomal protein S16
VAVKIRLMRMGKRKQPTYRVVVADSRSPRNGRFIEIIGQYRPRQEPSVTALDEEKALSWLRKGAQPTEQVQKLLAVAGVWARFESEKRGPIDTKLNRRRLGDPKASAKKAKKQAEAAKEEAAAAPEPETAAPEPETPAAEAGEESSGDAAEEPRADEPAAEDESAKDAKESGDD